MDDGQPAYLAVIIGVLVAVSGLLAAAIFFMVLRHRRQRQRTKKMNNNLSSSGSPLPDKVDWAVNGGHQPSPRLLPLADPHDGHDVLLPHHPHQGRTKIFAKTPAGHGTLLTMPGSIYGGSSGGGSQRMAAADAAASQYLLPQQHSAGNSSSSSAYVGAVDIRRHPPGAEYQEPYHALRFSPYYSCSTLLLAGSSDGHKRPVNPLVDGNFFLQFRRNIFKMSFQNFARQSPTRTTTPCRTFPEALTTRRRFRNFRRSLRRLRRPLPCTSSRRPPISAPWNSTGQPLVPSSTEKATASPAQSKRFVIRPPARGVLLN